MRQPDPIERVRIRLAAGGWVPTCHPNALTLLNDPLVEVQVKPFSTKSWQPMTRAYEYKPRAIFRARVVSTKNAFT